MTKARNQSEVNCPGTLEQWQTLLDDRHADLREAAATINPREPAAVERLRSHWPMELVRLAIELADARRSAVKKFGEEIAARLVCDVTGIEQASSLLVARYKAERFAEQKPAQIVDLCCGIGGDAMALKVFAPVTAVDQNDVRAWMTGCNANCETVVASAEVFDISNCKGTAVHIDPDRRTGTPGQRRRVQRFEEYQPGPAFLEELVASGMDVCMKLGPGVDFESLPQSEDIDIEVISEGGALVQALLWSGGLVRNAGLRTATLLEEDRKVSFTGAADEPIDIAPMGAFVFTIDAAIERLELLGAFLEETGLGAVHPKVGLLTADECINNPWLTAFAVEAFMPWRIAKVRNWLREHGSGIVEVKTRGRVVDPDVVQRQLRGNGDVPFTVFVLRMDKSVHAIICRRR